VWPVLMTWTHFDETGAVADSAGWLSCAKTNDSKELAEEASFAPVMGVPLGLEAVVWVVLLGVSMMLW
jgi:tRNA (adenine-N(1)-)-methyltransferase non-catalytic subunit